MAFSAIPISLLKYFQFLNSSCYKYEHGNIVYDMDALIIWHICVIILKLVMHLDV